MTGKRQVVEADHRNIVRHLDPALVQQSDRARRDGVGSGNNAIDALLESSEDCRQFIAHLVNGKVDGQLPEIL